MISEQMTNNRPARWVLAGVAAIAFMVIGAGASYLLLPSRLPAGSASAAEEAVAPGRPPSAQAGSSGSPASTAATGPHDTPLPDLVITLSPEAVQRAGIEVASVVSSEDESGVRVPGTVEPNAYRQVVVTPIVGGRVTRVRVQLGDRVTRGQPLADINSSELADAQTRYVSMQAQFEAVHQRLLRTERLVQIGAASQQELEQVRAEHAGHATDIESAGSRLQLLGLGREQLQQLRSAQDITSTVEIRAPIGGVVTRRSANLNLVVDASSELFTVVDLSNVWVMGDLYERDFARVKVGSPARITTEAYPALVLTGRVSYIDPQLNVDTRTARLRVSVDNANQQLRLGMYVNVLVGESNWSRALVVPSGAVQTTGDRSVVYLVDSSHPGRFTEREVRLGARAGNRIEVLSGLNAGDVVVVKGSFFVRAERERLGLRSDSNAAVQ